jgi:hypothetical protein
MHLLGLPLTVCAGHMLAYSGVGNAELFSLTLKFEVFTPGLATDRDSVGGMDVTIDDEEEDGVPMDEEDAARAAMSNDMVTMSDSDSASDAGVELNAEQLGQSLRDICVWV